MFFDDYSQITTLATLSGFSIFVLKDTNFTPDLKNLFTLAPDEKTGKISVESVRDFISLTEKKQSTDQFFLVRSPESMNAEASNAILKTLEEPKNHYHFLFFTKNPSALLPTILSRAQIFSEKSTSPLDSPVDFPEDIKNYAKRLMTLKSSDLPSFAKEISDKKDRLLAKNIVSAAIELSYKSYFKTGNTSFLKKLPNFLTLYDNLDKNGHIKLHFVADLL